MNIVRTTSFGLAVYTNGNQSADKLALVLPGRLDTKDYPNMRSHVDYLARRGYYAVSFDPPGTWESEGEISLYSMTAYKQAIDELIVHYRNRPTLLFGHSRGGSMAALAATKNTSVTGFVAVMSSCAYSPDKNDEYPNPKWKRAGYQLTRRERPDQPDKLVEYKLPYAFLEDSLQYDSWNDLGKYPKPKLYIYGEQDVLVEPAVVKQVFKVSAEPRMLARINSDHDYRFVPSLVQEVNNLVGEFLDKYF